MLLDLVGEDLRARQAPVAPDLGGPSDPEVDQALQKLMKSVDPSDPTIAPRIAERLVVDVAVTDEDV